MRSSTTSKPLRIIRQIPFFSERFGGPVVQMRHVCRELARRGHEVTVITSDMGFGEDIQRDTFCAEHGYRVWYGRSKAWNRVPPYSQPFIEKVLNALLPNADVLSINVGLTLAGAACRRMAKKHAIPLIYNAEGALCPTRLRIKAFRKTVFLTCFERRILRDAAALQAVTAKEAQDLERHGALARKVHVIPNGVPLPVARKADASPALRDQFGIAGRGPIVLFLGRLHRVKGIDILLDCIAVAKKQHPDIWLLIAGPDAGDLQSELARKARDLGILDAVRFCGILDEEKRDAALALADVFALTSRSEGLPNSVLEACAAGVPALITEACNLPELARYGAGIICPTDAEALSSALLKLLADTDKRKQMGEKGQRLIAERFSLTTVVDRLEALYRGLSAEQPSSREA